MDVLFWHAELMIFKIEPLKKINYKYPLDTIEKVSD